MMTAKEKALKLISEFNSIIFNREGDHDITLDVDCAIKCCNEVLGYMGSDRGYAFWAEVKDILIKFRDAP